MNKYLRWHAVITTGIMMIVLLGGALVTKTESGMGCGRSWPLCNDVWIPSQITPALIIEITHRICVAIAGFFVLFLCIMSWRKIGNIKETKFLVMTSVVFLLIQAGLGAGAVVWGQNDYIMALHFGVSIICFISVFLLTLLIFEIDKKWATNQIRFSSNMKFYIVTLLIYLFITSYTGALVRHMGATLTKPIFPFISMPARLTEAAQIGHRLAAIFLFFWIACMLVKVFKDYRSHAVMLWIWSIAFLLVVCQALTGILSVVTKANLYATLLHTLFITCLFGVISYQTMLALRKKN